MRKFRRLRDIAFLDIGSTKVCCCLVREREENIEVLGLGHYGSAGVKAGQVVDIEAVQQTVLHALDTAEEEAGHTAQAFFVAVPGCSLKTVLAEHTVLINQTVITEADIIRSLTESFPFDPQENLELLHAIPLSYAVDGLEGIEDPRGMIGKNLRVTAHFIAIPRSVLDAFRVVISRCHLDCAGFVAAPYAAGLALLEEEDLQLGVTVLDLGGHTSSFALFKGGVLVGMGAAPLGGTHITQDLAYGLSTSLANAERAKTLYGACWASSGDERDLVLIPGSGDQQSVSLQQVQKSLLVRIIRPRTEEIMDHVRRQLSPFPAVFRRRLLLTGDASQLPGMRDLTSTYLDKHVSMGTFQKILYQGDLTPGYAVVLGAARYFTGQHQQFFSERASENAPEGWKGFWHWIRQNL
ncbi:MAG: cell division protein FtsA [Holosporales bacterium]|jgi:cell division protein FtsA|nr:cell division protein FtsA [Holosporales bacterium]